MAEYAQILTVFGGGVRDIEYLSNMPYKQYLALRKAAEIEGIRKRQTLITDINAAFSGNKEHVSHLEKTYQEIIGTEVLAIKWEADKGWQDKLKKYKR